MRLPYVASTTLTAAELEEAIAEGRKRQKENEALASGRALVKGNGLEDTHITASECERAFCKIYNTKWRPIISGNKYGNPDAIINKCTFDAKWASDNTNPIMFVSLSAMKKHPWDIYAMMVKENDIYYHMGCISRQKVRTAEIYKPDTDVACYMVPREWLLLQRADVAADVRKIWRDLGPAAAGARLTDLQTGKVIIPVSNS